MTKIAILTTAAVIALASPAFAKLNPNGTGINGLAANAVNPNALSPNASTHNALSVTGLSLGGIDGKTVLGVELPR